MRCPKCGNESNKSGAIIGNTYVCSSCGNRFTSNENAREDITQIVKNIVETYGANILEDVDRTNALLMDYAPHSDKERKLVITVMREGVVSQLAKIVDDNKNDQKFKINRCVNQLVDSIWVTEAAARYAISVLAVAMGIESGVDTIADNGEEQSHRSSSDNDNSGKILEKDAGVVSEDAIQYALKSNDIIGYKAFAANTNITQLILPENIKAIYSKAFLNCINLCSIKLPKEIKSIGSDVFEGCSSLSKIDIVDGQHYKVIDGVLIDKKNKKTLRAENDNARENVSIVNGVSTICRKTFDRSPAKCITIPQSVNCIEANSFFLTHNLEKFEVDPKNNCFRTRDGILYNTDLSILVRYPQGKKDIGYYLEDTVVEIGQQAFSCVQHIQAITFTSFLKKIGNKAFEYCMNIENIMLPGNVEIIGDRAFQYCENMKSVMLSKNINEIGDCAFLNCSSLETISIPKNVRKIGNMAFANCNKLKKVTIQENVSFIGDGAFVGCDEIEIFIKNNPYMETYCHSREIKFTNI